jgi:glyoxylase-like metal-dependent hydrolase (beta-lactamase superfamily II)
VGHSRVAIIDPGPYVDSHVRAVVREVGEAEQVWVLLTHGHADHSGAAKAVAEAVGAEILGVGIPAARPFVDGEAVETDQGRITSLDTPGHSREHVTFHWIEAEAGFPGDVVLGQGETTWVGEYEGCVADYLESLERLRAVGFKTLYSGHGPAIEDPGATLDAFEKHRRGRIRQVEEILAVRPGATTEELLAEIYGSTIPAGLESAALQSLQAIREFLS